MKTLEEEFLILWIKKGSIDNIFISELIRTCEENMFKSIYKYSGIAWVPSFFIHFQCCWIVNSFEDHVAKLQWWTFIYLYTFINDEYLYIYTFLWRTVCVFNTELNFKIYDWILKSHGCINIIFYALYTCTFIIPLLITEIFSPALQILKEYISEYSVENVQARSGQILFNTLQFESAVWWFWNFSFCICCGIITFFSVTILLTYSLKKQFPKLLFPAASQCDDEVSFQNNHKSFRISFL